MELPTLSHDDKTLLNILQSIKNDDLYAMLGTEELYKPLSAPEAFLFGISFETTKEAISQGKEKFRQIKELVREKLCSRWKALKEHFSTFDQEIILAIVLESIRSLSDAPHFPCEIAAALICKTCKYNLDKFCG
ncbi:MAG: hypothetical protein ACHQ2F_03510 [Desulfobaccales bacterium]